MLTDSEQLELLMAKERLTRPRWEQWGYGGLALVFAVISFTFLQLTYNCINIKLICQLLGYVGLNIILFSLLPGTVIIAAFAEDMENGRIDSLFLAGFSLRAITRSKWRRRFGFLIAAAGSGNFLIIIGAIVMKMPNAPGLNYLFNDGAFFLFAATSVWQASLIFLSMYVAVILSLSTKTNSVIATLFAICILLIVVAEIAGTIFLMSLFKNDSAAAIFMVTLIILFQAFVINVALPMAQLEKTIRRFELDGKNTN